MAEPAERHEVGTDERTSRLPRLGFFAFNTFLGAVGWATILILGLPESARWRWYRDLFSQGVLAPNVFWAHRLR